MLEKILSVSERTLGIDTRGNPMLARGQPVDPSAYLPSVSIALWSLLKKNEI